MFVMNYQHMEALQVIEEKDDTESSSRATADACIQLNLARRLQQVDI